MNLILSYFLFKPDKRKIVSNYYCKGLLFVSTLLLCEHMGMNGELVSTE
jgi:hypothetical protein